MLTLEQITTGTIEGTGSFDKIMQVLKLHMAEEHETGRITGSDYAKVYVGGLQYALSEAIRFETTKDSIDADIAMKAKQLEILQAQLEMLNQQKLTEVQNTAIKTYENTVLQPDQHSIALKQIDKSVKEALMLTSQNAMIIAQTSEIAPNALKQRSVQDGQISQMTAETNYTSAKQTVMEQSRIDNLALEALKAQMTNLATVGAGGLTPSTSDFSAANSLRAAIYERARGSALPAITFTAGTAYTKAT